MENHKEKLIEAYHRFKKESETVTDAQWSDYNKRAEKFIDILHKAGMESHKQTALLYWDAAGRRTWNEREQLNAVGAGGDSDTSTPLS